MNSLLINASALCIPLADRSVQMVATSPPYFGLRDYGTAVWEGGEESCDHKVGRFEHAVSEKQKSNAGSAGHQAREICPKCGAVRVDKQIGMEETVAEYVKNLVCVFEEVRRVLKDDGVVWLNLGDSYNGSGGAGGDYNKGGLKEGQPRYPGRNVRGLKPKDLIGVPWRVAFELQEAGWWLRSDVIWHKPNVMPSSVKDRPTTAHEYVFLLSKSRQYYYDYEAIMEPTVTRNKSRRNRDESKLNKTPGRTRMAGLTHNDYEMRNKRSVWTINTSPYKGAHFATWPPALVEPMITAGSRAGDIVLDPFAGSGTTLMVANSLGRLGVGLDLSYAYLHEQATKRIGEARLKLW